MDTVKDEENIIFICSGKKIRIILPPSIFIIVLDKKRRFLSILLELVSRDVDSNLTGLLCNYRVYFGKGIDYGTTYCEILCAGEQ